MVIVDAGKMQVGATEKPSRIVQESGYRADASTKRGRKKETQISSAVADHVAHCYGCIVAFKREK